MIKNAMVPKAIDGVPVRWLNSHYLNVEPLIARTYGAIPPSLPFSHYRFAERARRFGRSDRLAKHLHKVIDTSGPVPRLADAAVSNMECGNACPPSNATSGSYTATEAGIFAMTSAMDPRPAGPGATAGSRRT